MSEYDPIRDFERVEARNEAAASRYSPENIENVEFLNDHSPETLPNEQAIKLAEPADVKPNTEGELVGHLFTAHCDHDHPFIRGEVKRMLATAHRKGQIEALDDLTGWGKRGNDDMISMGEVYDTIAQLKSTETE